jgi:hypothetical protein
MDDLTRKRQYRVRSRRFRARQRQGRFMVTVEVTPRVVSFLFETGRLGDAQAEDRAAIARQLALIAEDAVSAWEAKEGRISTA